MNYFHFIIFLIFAINFLSLPVISQNQHPHISKNSVKKALSSKPDTTKPFNNVTANNKTLQSVDCAANSTCNTDDNSFGLSNLIGKNKDMLMRTFYVLIAVSSVVVVYFVIKTIRLRRRRNRSKKYGLITSRNDNLELTPLEQEDDDDDMTVFELNKSTQNHKR